MRRANRIQDILRFLRIHESCAIRELAEHFEVSTMTIRRDLSVLEGKNLVRVFHGGVLLNHASNENISNDETDYTLFSAESKHREEKERIGKRAAELVQPNDMIIVDTGTTTECVVKALPKTIPLTVLCYSMNSLSLVSRMKNVDIIFAGGYYHEQAMMFESSEGIELIKKNRATKAFMAAAGVHLKLGLTSLPYETLTKQAALESSLTNILVVDSSKFGVVYPAYYADLTEFDTVVTDSGIDDAMAEEIKKLGVELLIA